MPKPARIAKCEANVRREILPAGERLVDLFAALPAARVVDLAIERVRDCRVLIA
jgi:hypothetical protein